MRTKILTVENIKTLLLEILLNKTNKISKISGNSVVNGLLYSISKLFQKGMKDSAIIESEQFSDSAVGEDLDLVSLREGIGPRFGPLNSSTFVRVMGEYGTKYSFEKNIFSTSSGVQFKAVSDWTIPEEGHIYIKVQSLLQGSSMNVAPYTITKVLAPPTGHKYCINEVGAIGGREYEEDDLFRQRVQKKWNILSTETLGKLTQVMISINPSILLVRKIGRSSNGSIILGLVTQNGVDLTVEQLDELLTGLKNSLCLSDLKINQGKSFGIELINMEMTLINLDFRVELFQNSDLDNFSLVAQTKISKYLDWRFWDTTKKVEWDELFLLIKKQPEVKYIADQYFIPRSDLVLKPNTLPRLNSFIIRNLAGEILVNNKGSIKPVFYQNYLDTSFNSTVLANL